MNKLMVLLLIFSGMVGHPQDTIGRSTVNSWPGLFEAHEQPLAIRLRFSSIDVRRNTNDSTYLPSSLYYRKNDGRWDSVHIKLRARGNYRLNNCNYVPLKLKLNKRDIEGTLFGNNPKLKIVLPCLAGRHTNDYVLKEYMAYKFFERISPYHFKTRLVALEYENEKNSRIRTHELKAILIEDMEQLAERYHGREMTQQVHPLQQDGLASLRNSLFQYLIGNTDYSTRGQHNEKLLYADNKYVSIPFDFDMSGLVNASYATISGLENVRARISSVRERVYKGYKRDGNLLQEVRRDFIEHKDELFGIMDSLRDHFESSSQFNEAKDFIADFFKIIEDDERFQRHIVENSRTR